MMEDIINSIFEKIKKMEKGTEFRMIQLFDEEEFKKCSERDLLPIDSEVRKKCKENNINLVSMEPGIGGMPYVVKFIKE